MAVTRRGDRRKAIRSQSGRRKGGIEKIKFEGERDKEQEVTVRHEAVSEKKAGSVWSWHEEFEEFVAEWSESFISKKREKIQKDEKQTRQK
jgi:hypothetical protein